MKMHEYSPLGADPRCEHCGLSEQEGNHSIEVGGTWTGCPPMRTPAHVFATSNKEAMPFDEDDRRFMGVDMVRDEEEICPPVQGQKVFMEMKLDRARIGLKLLDTGDDAKTTTCLTYPGIPVTRTVDLDKGNFHYTTARLTFQADLIKYLASHGVKAEFIL